MFSQASATCSKRTRRRLQRCQVQMKRYFERRGVPGQPHTAECYLRMRSNLMNAAEEFGKAWRRAEGNPEMAMAAWIALGHREIGMRSCATDFLDQIWDALIFIYKGTACMSTLEGQERQALRPFSPVEAILVPLPGAGSMLEVARFHDGESFWEVAPDLADSVAALWALSGFFPPELRPLFVECFGVREVVDAAALREGIQARINHGKRGGQSRGSGGFGFVAGDGRGRMVNELGLPEELLRALGGDTVTEADALAAAEEALASLRRRGRGGHSGSSDDEALAGATRPMPAMSRLSLPRVAARAPRAPVRAPVAPVRAVRPGLELQPGGWSAPPAWGACAFVAAQQRRRRHSTAAAAAAVEQSAPPEIFRKDYQEPSCWIREARLTVRIFEQRTEVRSRLRLERAERSGEGLALDGEELRLKRVVLAGLRWAENCNRELCRQPASFSHAFLAAA
ncbi:unnamed protein product [Effrenium voratum]|nr:unnamed protein product [Effrenium voratum]